ncbi:uncharacterized protein LOC144453859 [Glandiceps talaboti]
MLKFVVLLFAVIALANAQMYTDETVMDGDDKTPMPMHEDTDDHMMMMMCMQDSDCGHGMCHFMDERSSICRCPKNYFGDHCENHKPLQCIVCDGFVHEHDQCSSGMNVAVQNCTEEQTFCKTEIWYGDDNVMWLKRHGCSAQCWNNANCGPHSPNSCVACCDYERCFGYEKEILNMAAGASIVTSGIVSVSIAVIASIFM